MLLTSFMMFMPISWTSWLELAVPLVVIGKVSYVVVEDEVPGVVVDVEVWVEIEIGL